MNNYDTGSVGVNLELECFYDQDLAQIYYNDFINDPLVCHRVDFYILGDSDQLFFKKSYLSKTKKADLVDMYGFLFDYYIDEESTKREMIEEWESLTYTEVLTRLREDRSWFRFIGALDDLGIDYYISRGYRQGDACCIIKLNNSECPYSDQDADRIIWDTPIYCRLIIDGHEIDPWENLDPYGYDKDQIIKEFDRLIEHEKKAYIMQWLADNLPTNPDYL